MRTPNSVDLLPSALENASSYLFFITSFEVLALLNCKIDPVQMLLQRYFCCDIQILLVTSYYFYYNLAYITVVLTFISGSSTVYLPSLLPDSLYITIISSYSALPFANFYYFL